MLLNHTSKHAFKVKFFGRIDKCVEDHHLAFIALDPRIHYAGLSPLGIRKVNDIIMVLAAKLIFKFTSDKCSRSIKELGDYRHKCGIFESYDAYGNLNITWDNASIARPFEFWNGFSDCSLSIVGICVTSYVPQACSAERNWSSHIRIHTKERNRLKQQNVKKIARVKHAYRKRQTKRDVIQRQKQLKKLLHPTESISIAMLFGCIDDDTSEATDSGEADGENDPNEANDSEEEFKESRTNTLQEILYKAESDNDIDLSTKS